MTVAGSTVHAVTLHLGGVVSSCLDPQVAGRPPHVPVRARTFGQTREAVHSRDIQRQVSGEPVEANRLGTS